jgi:Dehydrogenases with different specificities (related to short-chain alcohol dehydrogenases)
MRVEGKVAVVTGAANGLGRAIATLLAKEGATVVVTDIDHRMCAGTAEAIQEVGAIAHPMLHDVTRDDDWNNVLDETMARFGRIDILVNNAGISGSAVENYDGVDDWHKVINVNLNGVFLGTRLATKIMEAQGGGSIVNISSIMGIVGSLGGHAAYSASKGGVRSYTKTMALRYGPKGVRVNSIHPGFMPVMQNAKNAGDREKVIRHTPLRRLGRPEDVAYGVLYLASDESSFVTGAELVIDGGWVAQ